MTRAGAILPVLPRGDLAEISGQAARPAGSRPSFGELLEEAIASVDRLQREGEEAQAAFARGEDVDLHDVLLKVEEAEVAFKTMMEIRNKLVEAYREIMRMGV